MTSSNTWRICIDSRVTDLARLRCVWWSWSSRNLCKGKLKIPVKSHPIHNLHILLYLYRDSTAKVLKSFLTYQKMNPNRSYPYMRSRFFVQWSSSRRVRDTRVLEIIERSQKSLQCWTLNCRGYPVISRGLSRSRRGRKNTKRGC